MSRLHMEEDVGSNQINKSNKRMNQDNGDSDSMDLTTQFKASVHVMKALNAMRANGEFCDLEFELSSTRFSVHRVIMAAWSPVLKNLLQYQAGCRQCMQVAYDKPEVFQQFITFLYTGIFEDEVSNVPAFLLLASTFQIHFLIDLCEECLKSNTSIDNVISYYHQAIKFRLSGLELCCVDFLKQHLPEVAQRQELRELSPSQMNTFLGSEHMSKLNPEMKLFLIISWLTDDVPSRQQYLVLLLGHIDWSVVANDFLQEISMTENFFTSNPSSLYLLLQTLNFSSIPLGPYEDQFPGLREQYSHLLGSVVSSSVALGRGQPHHFKPISFSLVSRLEEDGTETKHVRDFVKGHGSKLKTQNSPKCNDKEKFEVDGDGDDEANLSDSCREANVTATTPISSSPTQKSSNSTERSLAQDSCLTSLGNISRDGSMKNTTSSSSATIEGSMRRKCLRPRKIITDVDTVMHAALMSKGCSRTRKEKAPSRARSARIATKKDTFAISCDKEEESSREFMQEEVSNEDDESIRMSKKRKAEESFEKEREDPVIPTFIKAEAISEEEGDEQQQLQNSEQESKKKRGLRKRNRTKATASSFTAVKEAGSHMKAETRTRSKAVKEKPEKGSKVKTESETQLQLLKCSDCDFTADNRQKLVTHRKQVHEGNCLFCCSLCSFKSKWSKEYYNHMKEKHFPGPPFHCDDEECSYNTEKFQDLISHRQKHVDQRPFVCDICLMAFRSKQNLYAHFKTHSDKKNFECPECHRCFRFKNALEQHMVTHSDLRPYLCDLCGFSTKFQSHLISHKRTHTGEVFRCNFPNCKYSTPKQSQLKSHMRSHLGIRRHVCSLCGKAFVEKSHLVRHERIHSSERTYVCTDCSYSTTRSDKLKEHRQKHHSEEALKAKAAAAASTKTGPSGKAKTRGKGKAPTGQDSNYSIVQVVLVKQSSAKNTQPGAGGPGGEMAGPGSLSDKDLSVAPVSNFQFQPLNVASQATASVAAGSSTLASSSISDIISNKPTTKLVKQAMVTNRPGDALTGIGLQVAHTSSGGEPVFAFPTQSGMDGEMVDSTLLSTLEGQAITAAPPVAQYNKAASSDQISRLLQQQPNTVPGGLTIPSFAVAGTASNFPTPSTQFGLSQAQAIPTPSSQQSYISSRTSNPVIMVPSLSSSSIAQQYYQSLPQQQQQQQQNQQQTMEQQQQSQAQQSALSTIGDYLYQV